MIIVFLILTLFDADFRQTRTSAMLDAPQVVTGHMHYAAPDTIEWRYDGNEATSLPPEMLRYIKTMVAEQEDASDGWHEVSPLPKQVKRLFTRIRIRMEGGVAREVVMTEHGGDETRIEFMRPKAELTINN